MSDPILSLLRKAPRHGEPGYSDFVEALEEYTDADKAAEKAHDAWQIARQRLLARQEALERIVNAAVREREHDPATCRDGDHHGQCSGVTR